MVSFRVASLVKESVTPSWQTSAAWMPESIGRCSIGVGHRHPVNAQGIIQDTVYEASLSVATLDWCPMLSC